ncbi:MAG: sterol desaturase family protein [Planctomycetota bacterium]|jgi:sterol desaturase/sphingolipid hydroxylase (fatty acid hydroxylase superfamily)
MFEQIPQSLVEHFWELCAFGGVFVILELIWPLRKDQTPVREQSFLDLIYSFLLVVVGVLIYFLPAMLADSAVSMIGRPLTVVRDWTQTLNPVLQIVLAVVAIDLLGYWRHRLMHSAALWPVHAIHHCSTRLDWLSTDRFHLLNHVITLTLNTVVLILFFGIVPTLVSMYVRRFYGMFVHCNVRCSYGPLDRFFVSPLVHHWHHSKSPEAMNKNYASIFSIFDRVFGTFYVPDDRRFPEDLGVPESITPGFVQHFVYPFKAWFGRAGEREGDGRV